MSVTKFTAGITAPDGTSAGVSPEANQNTMICIGFKEIEVYGRMELLGNLLEQQPLKIRLSSFRSQLTQKFSLSQILAQKKLCVQFSWRTLWLRLQQRIQLLFQKLATCHHLPPQTQEKFFLLMEAETLFGLLDNFWRK